MKGFKGTPGPWVIDGVDVGAEFNIDSADGGTSVGITSQIFRDKDKEIRRANAQLIAAAPELLSALQDALHAYDKHGEHSEWDFARAAIAKALGESQ
ncbi:hypothetical protein VRB23_06485 [Erwinia aphidicola]|uniref:hypothetical protein n=1 Tax=Erwinia aphidicola TaxID=68334 RepID=UPI0030D41634